MKKIAAIIVVVSVCLAFMWIIFGTLHYREGYSILESILITLGIDVSIAVFCAVWNWAINTVAELMDDHIEKGRRG